MSLSTGPCSAETERVRLEGGDCCGRLTLDCSRFGATAKKCGAPRVTSDFPDTDPVVHVYHNMDASGSLDIDCHNQNPSCPNCKATYDYSQTWSSAWDGSSFGLGCITDHVCSEDYVETSDTGDCPDDSFSDSDCPSPPGGSEIPQDQCTGFEFFNIICGISASTHGGPALSWDITDCESALEEDTDVATGINGCTGGGTLTWNYSNEFTTEELIADVDSVIVPEPVGASIGGCGGGSTPIVTANIGEISLLNFQSVADCAESNMRIRIDVARGTDTTVHWTERITLSACSGDFFISDTCKSAVIPAGDNFTPDQFIPFPDIIPYLSYAGSCGTISMGTSVRDVGFGDCPA